MLIWELSHAYSILSANMNNCFVLSFLVSSRKSLNHAQLIFVSCMKVAHATLFFVCWWETLSSAYHFSADVQCLILTYLFCCCESSNAKLICCLLMWKSVSSSPFFRGWESRFVSCSLFLPADVGVCLRLNLFLSADVSVSCSPYFCHKLMLRVSIMLTLF